MKNEFEALATKLAKQIAKEIAKGRNFRRVKKLAAAAEILAELGEEIHNGSPSLDSRVLPTANAADGSPKAKGKHARETWVAARQKEGYSLAQVRGALYDGARGTVGVAFASETPKRDGYFFLGLPAEKLAVAVLLCDEKQGTRDVVLGPTFLAKHIRKLSRSHDQVKFNVRVRSTGAVELHIPGREWVSVTAMVGDYSPLK